MKKNFISFIITLFIFFNISAESQLKDFDLSKNNSYLIIDMTSDLNKIFNLTITEVNKKMTDKPIKIIKFKQNDKIIVLNLKPGEYYFSYFGTGNFALMINKSTKKFIVKENIINFIGILNIRFDSKNIDAVLIHNFNNESFEKSKYILKENYLISENIIIENNIMQE